MNHLPSVQNHCESPLNGSTLSAMIDRALALGRTHFPIADNGHLSSAYKAYSLAQKKGLKPILGIEIYFKDSDCNIVKNTKAQRIKYYTGTIYCRDQEAYQALCQMVSRTDYKSIEIYEEAQNLWTWKHLEEISKYNVDFICSGPHDIVGKNLIAGEGLAAQKVFNKLLSIFGCNFYVALLVEPWTKKWQTVIEIRYTDGTRSSLLGSDTVTTDRARNIKAFDLTQRSHHTTIKGLVTNNTFYNINKTIDSVSLRKGFLPLGTDITLSINKLLLGLAQKNNVPVLITDYAYYAEKSDKIVQTMRFEGRVNMQPNLHMKSVDEISEYLNKFLSIQLSDVNKYLETNNEWAKRYDNFNLKYQWRLADPGTDAIKKTMEIIKQNGRMKWNDPKYTSRLKEELEVIHKNGIYDLIPYFLPIRDVLNYYKEKGFLTGPGRGCLTGDAKVLSSEGFKPLKDIVPGDRVFSHTGKIRKVTNTMEYDVKESLLEITSNFAFGTIKLTKDHKLFGVKGKNKKKHNSLLKTKQTYVFKKTKKDIDIDSVSWMKAEEFSVGDYLFMPWIKNRKVNNVPDLDLSLFCSNILDISSKYIEYGTKTNKTKIVRNLHFNHKMVRIIGRWIGNGWIDSDLNSKTVGITYNSHDVSGQDEFFNFMADLGFLPKKVFDKKLVKIIIDSHILYKAFKYLFPDYKKTSDTKYIGQFMYLEDSLLRELLIGLQQANVHSPVYNSNKEIAKENINTASYRLANEIKQALLYLKIPSSVNYAQYYDIKFNGLTTPKSKALFENGNGYLVKISNIKEITENKVYDITVEKDRSYVTSNYTVHNSAGGSLLCYLMGITQIDPFKYDLPFQRFFSMVRIKSKKLPDIDVDLEDRTPLVGEDGHSGFLYNNWGNKAAQISTRTTMRLKSAILDTNRYINGSVEESIALFSKNLPTPPQGVTDHQYVFGYEDSDENHIPGLIEISEELKKYSKTRPKEWNIVSKAMGLTRAFSKHASAFVIADTNIENILPTKDGNVAQYEAKDVESVGLVKYDFLVIKQLKDIRVCLELINKKNKETHEVGYFSHNGKPMYIWDLPQDLEVYKSIWNGRTETLFQINTQSMRPYVIDMLPSSISDIAALQALVRPGPLDAIDEETGRNMTQEYMARRRGESEPSIKEMVDILPDTFGIMCFQEDLGKIARKLAGFSGEEAELLRENMAKKKMVELLKMKPAFIEGAVKQVSKETAEKIWEQMVTFGRYGFSIIHAVEYSHVTYACMYLRHHYNLEWWCAILSNATEQEITGVFWPYVQDFVLPPDINLSGDQMVVDYANNKIRSKLGVIRGMGEASIEPIIQGRPYTDIQDYVNKDVAGQSLSNKLIHVGVLDSLFPPKSSLLEKLQLYQNAVEIKKFNEKVEHARINNKKIKATEPKLGSIPEEYLKLEENPFKDIEMKKGTLPSMPINMHRVARVKSKYLDKKASIATVKYEKNDKTLRSILVNGEQVKRLEDLSGETLQKDVYVAATCYVIKTQEFSYSKNTKKALKLTLDIDGHIFNELVLWPDYDTGQLIYPDGLKRGSIVTVFFRKRMGKKDLNISTILLET